MQSLTHAQLMGLIYYFVVPSMNTVLTVTEEDVGETGFPKMGDNADVGGRCRGPARSFPPDNKVTDLHVLPDEGVLRMCAR